MRLAAARCTGVHQRCRRSCHHAWLTRSPDGRRLLAGTADAGLVGSRDRERVVRFGVGHGDVLRGAGHLLGGHNGAAPVGGQRVGGDGVTVVVRRGPADLQLALRTHGSGAATAEEQPGLPARRQELRLRSRCSIRTVPWRRSVPGRAPCRPRRWCRPVHTWLMPVRFWIWAFCPAGAGEISRS